MDKKQKTKKRQNAINLFGTYNMCVCTVPHVPEGLKVPRGVLK